MRLEGLLARTADAPAPRPAGATACAHMSEDIIRYVLGFPPDAFQNGDYAFFGAEKNAAKFLGIMPTLCSWCRILGDYADIMLVVCSARLRRSCEMRRQG